MAQEGQVTERFTRAIEQLGHEEMEVRLGGIYALERLAKDSEKDHGPIMEVLTAYVREKATKQGEYAEKAAVKKPTVDIQAILTVIGRRETTGNNRGNDLDLGYTHLAGAYLAEANLSRAYLRGVNLSGASLIAAKNLTAEQVLSTKNWHKAILPDHLNYLKDTPEPPA